MAVWRTKAYELFGLKPGDYSSARGKVVLFRDLVDSARAAVRDDNQDLLARIVEYVVWAAEQESDELDSVVDLAFFLPVFRESMLCEQLRTHIPEALFAEKWRLLMVPPTED